MWTAYFYASGLLQWLSENLHPLLSVPAALLAILFWRKAKQCAEKDLEIRKLQARLLNTTLCIEVVNEWTVCPSCLEKKRQNA